MQIITGIAKGKKLKVPKNKTVRPTTSRVKKSIFDKLGNIESKRVLDLFAGSGNLGIEALSGKAKHVTFVDNNRKITDVISQNIESCNFSESSKVLTLDYKKAIDLLVKEEKKFDIIFIDPPYEIFLRKDIQDFVKMTSALLEKRGTIVIEHNKGSFCTDNYVGSFEVDTRDYGSTRISFIRSLNR